jgi:NADH:ubiquinone oxidoreductase subunit F (NADH-binding)/NADH:ubiquinone oxidoreductase subunit E
MSQNLVQLRRRYAGGPDASHNALQLLKRVMREQGRITPDDIHAIAQQTHQPEAAVYGVATFYGDLGLTPRGRTRVKVCKGTACFASCHDQSAAWFEDALSLRVGQTSPDGGISLEPVYCLGFCNHAPAALVNDTAYAGLTEDRAQALCQAVRAGTAPPFPDAEAASRPPMRTYRAPAIVLERLVHDPGQAGDMTRLDVARAHHAYEALARALAAGSPDAVLEEVVRSQLRGRGGAGFATGLKWRFAAQNRVRDPGGPGYVVCNGDEGDPGSYIDKYLMEGDPHALLEGVTLAGYATRATRGFIYVRSEYPRSRPALLRAIEEARGAGLLGADILGSGWSFDIDVVEGAGSYVCGEETALLRSLEGLRGMVTARPPFPAERGLFDAPTIVNNVETLVNVPWIVRHGGGAYAALGHNKSRGTKTVSLNDLFVRPGIYEVPFGLPLREILTEVGGGLRDGRRIKAVQVGGPLGGILPEALLDVPFGFDELAALGAMVGHGGVVAFDERTDMRALAVHLFEFCDEESCGKCFPCRLGGRRGLELSHELLHGAPPDRGEEILGLLAELCETMKLGSLCAHGGGIPAPIESLLLHFKDELLSGRRSQP